MRLSQSSHSQRKAVAVARPKVIPLICESDYARPRTALSQIDRRDSLGDDLGLGRLRAFDAFHRHHQQELERESRRSWAEQERIRVWRARQAHSRIGLRTKEKDRGILESIVSKRDSDRKLVPPSQRSNVFIGRRPLPKEDRAIYHEATRRVFYWGA